MSKDLIKKFQEPIPVDPDMNDFRNDPYIVAKTEKARKFLVKYDIPKSSKNNPKSKSTKLKSTPKKVAKLQKRNNDSRIGTSKNEVD